MEEEGGSRPNLGKNEAARGGGLAGPASRVIKPFEASDAGSGVKHCLAAAPPCPITPKRLTNPTPVGGSASNIDAVCVDDTCITCPGEGEHDNRTDRQSGAAASERNNAGCKLYTMGVQCSAGCAEWGSNMALSAVTTPLSSTVPANELDGKFGRLSVQ